MNSRGFALYRTAYLIVGDRRRADALTRAALTRLIGAWTRARREDPERYARRLLVHLALRRHHQPTAASGTSDAVIAALQALPLRSRAELVLRHYDRLSDRDVAHVLGTSAWRLERQRKRTAAALSRRLSMPGGEALDAVLTRHLELAAPSSSLVLEWHELLGQFQVRRRVRRTGAVAVALALTAAVVVISPWNRGSPDGYTPALPNRPEVPPPGQLLVLDANGCPPGDPIVRTSDEAGETALVRTAAGTWVCTSATAQGEPVNYFSDAWTDLEVSGDDGSWLGPLSLETCAGTPCGSVLWSAVSSLPPGVSNVVVRVVGEQGVHDATESESTWVIRLRRPVADNVVTDTRHTEIGDTLQVTVAFGHEAAPDPADTTYIAVDAPLRRACQESLSATAFPPWSHTSCSNDMLQRNLGHTGDDLAFRLRFDAQCEWLAEYLTASDSGNESRAASALEVIADVPTWPGFADNALGTYIAMLGRQAANGDLEPMRQQFPNTPGAASNCSADYLAQAGGAPVTPR